MELKEALMQTSHRIISSPPPAALCLCTGGGGGEESFAPALSMCRLASLPSSFPTEREFGGGRIARQALANFSVMSLKRQHSKKGKFVSSNAGLWERDFRFS